MKRTLETHCDICGKVAKTRYIDLFVMGSEGTRLCHDCEMLVVEFIRDKKHSVMDTRIRDRLKAKGA